MLLNLSSDPKMSALAYQCQDCGAHFYFMSKYNDGEFALVLNL